jgi:uncharacterized protein DUF5808
MNKPDNEGSRVPDAQGKLLGIPYDMRRPTSARILARMWNPEEPRLFPPKAFGWGYSINLYRLSHWRR